MDDLREEFIAETREMLGSMAEQLLFWEKNPHDQSLIDNVFRFVHTVKGSCGFLDLPRLRRLSHAAEDVLSAARDGQLVPSTALVTAVLQLIDRIAELTDALETGAAVRDNDNELISAMLAFLPNPQVPISEKLAPALHADEQAGAQEPVPGFLNKQGRTVRVSLALLDKLMNGISDMVLARNEVSRQLRKLDSSNQAEAAFARLSTSVAEMRDVIGQMRLQNIDKLFSSLPRTLRDICQELGKKIDLVIEGNEVEVDREMAEALRDPLIHILRNAADHGIEPADERQAAGKADTGRIKIVARQSGNQILVEISDDGRGIDLEKLGAKAVARNLYTQAQWQKLTDKAKLDTIFLPGLSTASSVSAISGRGVGMDVVRTNIVAIGGTVDLENAEGRGLKLTLRLPLTLSIIAGLSVTAGGQTFGLTRSSIVEILSMKNRNVAIEQIGGVAVAKIRESRFAFANLEEIVGTPMHDNLSDRTLIVVRPAVGATFVLGVAAVVDSEEMVVKPGAPIVMATGLYSGMTLPDHGRPMLLLDASGLAQAIGAQNELFGAEVTDLQTSPDEQVQQAESALLFENADGLERAVRLAVVDRMEEVETQQLHHVGGRCCLSISSTLFDVIGFDPQHQGDLVKLLRISDGTRAIYLVINDVLDIFSIPASIDRPANPDVYEGIVHYEGRPVELINVYGLFASNRTSGHHMSSKPLCFIGSIEDQNWAKSILQPLLAASGYDVSFDETDREAADIILSGTSEKGGPADDRTLFLRDSERPLNGYTGSIYRYDRISLISAIEAKVAGAC